MKNLKYSVISEINIGDVFISESIIFLNQKLGGKEILSKDILGKDFDVVNRIQNAESSDTYKITSYSKFFSLLVLAIKKIKFILVDRKKIISDISKAETIILGGGNLLMEANGGNLFQMSCDIASIAKKRNKRVIVLAVGTGPFEFPYKKRLSKLINNSDVFFVRDLNSQKLCLESSNSLTTEVRFTYDPAFIIADIVNGHRTPPTENENNFIGFNFMNFARVVKNSDYSLKKVVDNVREISDHYKLPIKIINTSFGEDLSLSLKIKLELEKIGVTVEIINIIRLEDLNSAFSNLSFFVCSRMHSSIFSMSFGVPTLIFPWHSKVSSLQDLLFGSQSSSILLQSVNFDCKEVIEKIDSYPINKLNNSISEAKEKIWNDYALIK